MSDNCQRPFASRQPIEAIEGRLPLFSLSASAFLVPSFIPYDRYDLTVIFARLPATNNHACLFSWVHWEKQYKNEDALVRVTLIPFESVKFGFPTFVLERSHPVGGADDRGGVSERERPFNHGTMAPRGQRRCHAAKALRQAGQGGRSTAHGL